MPTRYSITAPPPGQDRVSTGYSNDDVKDNFDIPSCTIEDVDRGVFNLFNKELPLFHKRQDQMKRVPVIFATGERFAILSRNRPLRDKAGALILPLISIVRTGIDQDSAKGAGQFQGGPITIKVQLSEDDPIYQRLNNVNGFKNSDAIAIEADPLLSNGLGGGTDPDRLATRRAPPAISVSARRGTVLKPNLGKNLIEFIEMPPIKQYTASYEITFWTQYTQQMNTLLTIMMNGYVENRRRTFVIETESGYRFTAFVDAALNPQNNFDDFTDSERLVKYSFSISVAAYVVAVQEPGTPVPFRRTISAPEIAFDVSQGIGGVPVPPPPGGIPSGDPFAYMLGDMTTTDTGYPPAAVGGVRNPLASGIPGTPQVILGGQKEKSGLSAPTTIITDVDPFTGKKSQRRITVKATNPNKGETVFRDSLIPEGGLEIDLGKLFKD